jgi:N-glycosylase/DNA lyase
MTTTFFSEIREIQGESIPTLEIKPVGHFSVAKTFDCGQCFRFDPVTDTKHETEFSGVAYGRKISFAEESGKLYIYGATEDDFNSIWCRYLGLDTDYDAIDRDILSRSDSPALRDAVEYGRGIRILRQEPWEAVCSFIISQNNNIPRIKKIIAAMSEKYGDALGDNSYAFPTAKALFDAGESEIFALKTGFRAKYIFDAASRVCDGRLDLDFLDGSTDECVKTLCSVKGIGPKVALCSLLFGFGRLDAFPVDVWIRRVMEKYFREGFTPDELGPYAGIAQQYLFYYERYIVSQNEK